MPSITPFLWFEEHLEEAVALYRAVFPDARFAGFSHFSVVGGAGVMVWGV